MRGSGILERSFERLGAGLQRRLPYLLAKKTYRRPDRRAYISFTFDDVPVSACKEGGRILLAHGVRGTYYVSFGRLGALSPSGRIASIEELREVLTSGHEIGCHTYDHLHAFRTKPQELIRSINLNRAECARLIPDYRLSVFSYPMSTPSLRAKREIGKCFDCARGGSQKLNGENLDLSLLRACFIDWRNRDSMSSVLDLIERNKKLGGWLIFATHDVQPSPSRYGCTSEVFERLVEAAIESDATVLPVAAACRAFGLPSKHIECASG